VPIVEPLQALLGLPISFEHDVRAGAWAELHAGAARGRRDVAFLPIGTGIAAAFIIDGEVRSADGYMGEVGHAYVGPDDPCVCGLRGCLEAIASASAIARRYAAGGGSGDAAQVIARAAAGEPLASRVWNEALDGLALACSWMAQLLGPEAIIIGGGLARAGDALFTPLRVRLHSRLTYQRAPQLLPAVHGDDAGCLGAAVLALRTQGVR
jgi:glucokinase